MNTQKASQIKTPTGPRRYVLPLAANASGRISAGGRFYFIEDSGGNSFNMQFEDGGTFQGKEGIANSTDADFTYVNFTNINNFAISITIWLGPEGVSYFPKTISSVLTNAPTYLKGQAGNPFALADGASSAVYSGIDAATGKIRKLAIVGNPGNSTLAVLDANDLVLVQISPKNGSFISNVPVETSGPLYVQNIAGGGAGLYTMGEVFYE